jgi:hypothetical protein
MMAKKTNFYHKLAQKMQKKIENQEVQGSTLRAIMDGQQAFLPAIRSSFGSDALIDPAAIAMEQQSKSKQSSSSLNSSSALKSAVRGKFGLQYLPPAVPTTVSRSFDRDEKERADRRQLELIKFLKQENEILQKNVQEMRQWKEKQERNYDYSKERENDSRKSRRREDPLEESEQNQEDAMEESEKVQASISRSSSRGNSNNASRPLSRK